MRKIFSVLAIAASAVISAPATAVIVTIDPDAFASGTNLSTAFSGVTLRQFSHDPSGTPTFGDVFAHQDAGCLTPGSDCTAATGSSRFAPITRTADGGSPSLFEVSLCFAGGDFCESAAPAWSLPISLLLVEFSDLTDFAEISGAWLNDHVEAYAFDSSFNLISGTVSNVFDMTRCRSGGTAGDYCANTYSIQSATNDIRYLVAGSWAGMAYVDDLRYNSVPEPGTLALFGLGLLGLRLVRRSPQR